MDSHFDVVIVGAAAAGCSTAESLRNEGFTGSVVLLGEEPYAPYNRPPLSKQVLVGAWPTGQAEIISPAELARLEIEWRGDTAASALDRAGRVISTTQGDHSFGTLVIATGARARRLDTHVDAEGLALTLRSRDDAERLHDALSHAGTAIVLGSGVLGSEIAAAARALGCDVTIVGRSGTMTLGTAGDRLSQQLQRAHGIAGVAWRLAEGVKTIASNGSGVSVALASGDELTSDVVIAALGSIPNAEWLQSSGLLVQGGVQCDTNGMIDAGIYAVGDVAAWTDPVTGDSRRDEHQLSAIQQGQAVAHHIVTGEPSPPALPYFWSELYGVRYQAYGVFPPDSDVTVSHGSFSTAEFVAVASVDGVATGVVASNMSREFRLSRPLIDQARQSDGPPDAVTVGVHS